MCPSIEIVDTLLARGGTHALEVISSDKGKPIAHAIERAGLNGLFPGGGLPGCCDETTGIIILRKLIEHGANLHEPCTPQALYGSGRTPRWLVENNTGRRISKCMSGSVIKLLILGDCKIFPLY